MPPNVPSTGADGAFQCMWGAPHSCSFVWGQSNNFWRKSASFGAAAGQNAESSVSMLTESYLLFQEDLGVWGWELPRDDFETLSTMEFQCKYFDGHENFSEQGPYHKYQDLWDEPEPATQIHA